MIAEQLARLQPGGMNLEPTAGATGQRLELADLALALASVPHTGGRALVAYLYAGQDDQADTVCEAVRDHYGHGRCSTLVHLRLQELRYPQVCPHCQGRTTAWRGTVLVDCPECKGTGRRRISESSRARACHMARSTWYSGWREVYSDICTLLAEWEHLSLRKIKRLLA